MMVNYLKIIGDILMVENLLLLNIKQLTEIIHIHIYKK